MKTAIGWNDLIGKTIAKVEYVSPHTILIFDDDSFTVVEAHEGDYPEEGDEHFAHIPMKAEDVWALMHTYAAISIGLWTQEECETCFAQEESQRRFQQEQDDLRRLAELKAKYEKKE